MKRSLFGAAALAVVALTAVLIGTASAAKPPPAPTNNTCPTNAKNLPTSSIVGASVLISGSKSTYYFHSFTDPAQTSLGTPGLVNYCVYGTAIPSAVTVDPLLKGADGSSWTASKPGKNFGFSRPGGEKTNIELNGPPAVKMGTATWTGTASVPTAIVLHISSAAECARLGISSATCFVLPGTAPTGTLTVKKLVVNDNGGTKIATDFKFKVNNGSATSFVLDPAFPSDSLHGKNTVTIPSGAYSVVEDGTPITGYGTTLSAGCSGTMAGGGTAECLITNNDSPPVCDAGTGNTGAAYNSIPFDVVHCGPPAIGFEATQTNEFGDLVALSGSGDLQSMRVDFQSFGCGTSGHWYSDDCLTDNFPTNTFTIPGGITANIYAVDSGGAVGQLIATSTENPSIPYRPTKDDGTNCSGANAGKWYDPVSNACRNSWAVLVTFDNFTFPNGAHSFSDAEQVIWTVQFDTSTEGYNPIGACGNSDPGCGYDSLNVGDKTYANNAFAGTDVDEDVAYRSWNSGPSDTSSDLLIAQTGWSGLRPLGEIVLASGPPPTPTPTIQP